MLAKLKMQTNSSISDGQSNSSIQISQRSINLSSPALIVTNSNKNQHLKRPVSTKKNIGGRRNKRRRI